MRQKRPKLSILQKREFKSRNILSKARNKAAKLKAKTIKMTAKNEYKAQKLGILGDFTRSRLLRKQEKESKIQIAKDKPELVKLGKKTQIQTDARVKITQSRGKALAGVASALGSSYAVAKSREASAQEAKAKAEEAAVKLLSENSNGVSDVSTTYNAPSASGLVRGVR